MANLWTRAMVTAAEKLLRDYDDIAAALPAVSALIGFPVSDNSLRHAFQRHGNGSPSAFLRAGSPAEMRVRVKDMAPLERAEHDRDSKRERETHRETGRAELLMRSIAESVAKLPAPVLHVTREPTPKPRTKAAETVWISISDVQLGSYTLARDIGNLGPGNSWAMFVRKLARWEAAVIDTIRERQHHVRVESAIVAFLGDLVDGSTLRAGHAWECEVEVLDQCIMGGEAFAGALARIAATFPQMRFDMFSVSGNHGRVGKWGEEPFRSSFDRLLAHLIELRLKAAGVGNVHVKQTETWFQVVELHGRTHLLIHGDDVSGSAGMPYNGLLRMLGKNSAMMNRKHFAVHCGHFHSEATISHTNGTVFLSGNWMGASNFAKRIQENGPPVQMIHGFGAEDGHLWTRRIHLLPGSESAPRVDVHRIS